MSSTNGSRKSKHKQPDPTHQASEHYGLARLVVHFKPTFLAAHKAALEAQKSEVCTAGRPKPRLYRLKISAWDPKEVVAGPVLTKAGWEKKFALVTRDPSFFRPLPWAEKSKWATEETDEEPAAAFATDEPSGIMPGPTESQPDGPQAEEPDPLPQESASLPSTPAALPSGCVFDLIKSSSSPSPSPLLVPPPRYGQHTLFTRYSLPPPLLRLPPSVHLIFQETYKPYPTHRHLITCRTIPSALNVLSLLKSTISARRMFVIPPGAKRPVSYVPIVEDLVPDKGRGFVAFVGREGQGKATKKEKGEVLMKVWLEQRGSEDVEGSEVQVLGEGEVTSEVVQGLLVPKAMEKVVGRVV